MSFTTGLSGLAAAKNLLSVTGNNLANANTAGFKQSRSEFGDVYANSVAGVAATTPGSGVKTTRDAQQLTQGNLEFTENSLDMAISGEGMFVLGETVTTTSQKSFSRDGQFHLDSTGYVVNNGGNVLMAYKPNLTIGTSAAIVAGGFSTGLMQPLQINQTQSQPQATGNVGVSLNLDASVVAGAVAWNAALPNTTADYQTSTTIYDSLGASHVMSTWYKKQAAPANTWNAYYAIDYPTNAVQTLGSLTYNTSGQLTGVAGVAPVTAAGTTFNIPVAGQPVLPSGATFGSATSIPVGSINVAFKGSSQFGTPSSTNTMTQDGYASGTLIGVAADANGVVFARYSNGSSTVLGEVAVARFQNPQSLTKLGSTRWAESTASGSPIYGEAGKGSFGTMNAGALEQSNVDMAAELVKLIQAQQMYQANTQTISTENQIMTSLINLR